MFQPSFVRLQRQIEWGKPRNICKQSSGNLRLIWSGLGFDKINDFFYHFTFLAAATNDVEKRGRFFKPSGTIQNQERHFSNRMWTSGEYFNFMSNKKFQSHLIFFRETEFKKKIQQDLIYKIPSNRREHRRTLAKSNLFVVNIIFRWQ